MAKSFTARMRDRFKVITATYDKANKYTHETVMQICNHAKEHNDCSLAQELVMALPASIRREMLILWFSTYTPIVVKNDDKWASKMHKPGTKLYVEWDLEAGDEKPFYELAKENKEKGPLTLEELLKMVTGLASRIEKRVENGEVDEDARDSALEVVRQLSGIKVQKAANDTKAEKEPKAA